MRTKKAFVLFMASLLVTAAFAARAQDDPWLSNWMGNILDLIGHQTVLDLSLPGTHDTMTFDLNTVVSDGGIDGQPGLAALVHDFGKYDPAGTYLRMQAQTQASNITAQLDAGIRFIDFRIMQEYSTDKQWYCLHCVQTNQPALVYMAAIRTWLDAHPSEIVVIWLSKHGDESATGSAQYPNVSDVAKLAFWQEVTKLFDGVLFDASTSAINETAISDLVARQHRVVMWVSDWEKFTNKSSYALDAARIDNKLHGDSSGRSVNTIKSDFQHGAAVKAEHKKNGRFYLYSLATSPPKTVITDAAKLYFTPALLDVMATRRECAAAMNFPNTTSWCPETLLDVSQLANYYAQVSISAAYKNDGWDLPNAIYIDAVDLDGTIRTGTKLINAPPSAPSCEVFKFTSCSTSQPSCDEGWTANGDREHWATYDSDGFEHGLCGWAWQNHYKCCRAAVDGHDTMRFAYVDAFVAVNIRRSCGSSNSSMCSNLKSIVDERVGRHPLTLWHDTLTGRHETASLIENIEFVYV